MRTIITHSTSRMRGGSFFTMLIFIMMLLSCALMYYYFQRTRVLENEIAALRKGETPVAEGLSSWIPWSKSTPAESIDTSNSSDPISEEPPVESQEVPTKEAQPVTSSDTATINTMAPQMDSLAPISTETLTAEEPEAAPEIPSDNTDSELEQPVETENEPPKKIDSVYDTQPPPVRVRSPRR